jgi:tellurium resistance protein TerD
MRPGDLPGVPFAITNRGWYRLHRFLRSTGARNVDLMAEQEAFVPSRLAVHWGQCISSAGAGDWYLIGSFDGHAVVPSGIVHANHARGLEDQFELTPLAGTLTYMWLLSIGQELSTAVSGYLISGKPRKGSPMSYSTTKGEKVDLDKAAADAGTPGLTKLRVGLGWDARKSDGADFDLDAVVLGLNSSGKVVSDDWRVFFNNKTAPGNAIVHNGDNLTGDGDGDDETVDIDLSAIPDDVTDLRIYVTIYEATKRGNLNFGLVQNAFIRIYEPDSGTEVLRFDLSEDAGVTQSLEFGKIYRTAPGAPWNFKAIADGHKHELDGVFAAH